VIPAFQVWSSGPCPPLPQRRRRCATGSYAFGATICRACGVGQHNNKSSSTTCTSCAAGSFSPGGVIPDCLLCQPGEFSGAAGASACSSCALGSYADSPGSTSCVACSAGRFLVHPRVACEPCRPGSFSRPASTSCTVCAAGKIDNSSLHDQGAGCSLGGCADLNSVLPRLRQLSSWLLFGSLGTRQQRHCCVVVPECS